MTKKQNEMWDVLSMHDGETVARLFTDWLGNGVLDDGFYQFLIDEGYINEPDEEEDD